MSHFLCIHGHFYQPPRENPWLEAVEIEDSAAPYHDWNERITAECYEQNIVARILDKEGRIARIVNNYARMSFDVGPMLLAWLETYKPDVYAAILAADQESQERFSGHGSALAHAYNHMIMPLANPRDRETQVVWGIRDFESRFGREPEGMWLPEMAVDLDTLDLLAEHGIRFTILSPFQVARVRPLEGDQSDEWREMAGMHVDPTRPYVQRLPSGRTIALFFYDDPIARAVAFEGLLSSGATFAQRLMEGFDEAREHAQLVHIASNGETYGHHYRGGEMALAYALHTIEQNDQIQLTNYGEFLERFPPTCEVEIIERSSWSCPHGIERWYADCGCKNGKHTSWNQAWRGPLRNAFDWLRDTVAPRFEERAGALLYNPWEARNDYISVILDRSEEEVAGFLGRHATHTLNETEQTDVLKLLELQRQLLLMYTSSGWFFDDLSNIETRQVLLYAGRAIHLMRSLSCVDVDEIERGFLEMLEQAKSNLPEHRDGRSIYERWVRPAEVDLQRVGAHYAVTSLYERYPAETDIYCYRVDNQDYHRFDPGMAKVAIGRVRVTSNITQNGQDLSFGVMHFGEHNVNAGVREFDDERRYTTLVEGVHDATERGDIAEVVRLLDGYFHGLGFSVHSLFRDAQRTFLNMVLETTLDDDEATYRHLYERRAPLMHLLTSLNAPLPRALHAAAEFVVNSDLRRAIAETPPDYEYVQSILERARMWHIELDTARFTYVFQQIIEQIVEQMREQPDDLELIKTMDVLVDVTHSMPFEVDFWKFQNVYYEMANTVSIEMQERADEGEEDARAWGEYFVTLGDKLGIRMTEMQDFRSTPTIASITREVLSQRRIPRATYRFQFNPSFTFPHAVELVSYLHELGISECYASPIFRARSGSTHGYDVCDHNEISTVLGGETGFDALSSALRDHDMSFVIDIVPNHMGIGDVCNTWWMDVLENGPGSDYASYFDIEWKPVKPELENKVLLPILGDQYGRILENGELQLSYEDGAFSISYYEHRFPVAPGTYSHILTYQLDALTEKLGMDNEHLLEYQSILTAISYLPPRTELEPERRVERNREKEVIKRRIVDLAEACPDVQEAIETAVQAFNGNVGDPSSFDLLDELIDAQSYRLAYWRVAAEEINYRRFFDINDLAAIRTEDPMVFHDTHQLIFRLITEGKVTGLRLDHIDGLFEPAAYLQELHEGYVFYQVREQLARVRKTMPDDETLARRVANQIHTWQAEQQEQDGSTTPWPIYVVAEKILGENELLPQNWAVHGTTGYDFLASTNNLFVDTQHENTFDRMYQRFSSNTTPFEELVNSNKKMIMLVSMDSELYALSHQLERIAERNRRYRDFTLNTLTFAIREVIACLTVYRTYTTGNEPVLPRDRHYIEAAVADAKRRNPRTAEAVFDFILETLLLLKLTDFKPEDQEHLVQWVMKFQQVTGPVMAKGVEDTTFYVYNRLVSLNEVGGHPNHFGGTIASFHKRNSDNQRFWPHTLLCSSTHDTKRSEDVRARINVLSEIPKQWQDALKRWSEQNADKKSVENGRDGKPQSAPSGNDEYLLYQSLIGAWPFEYLAQNPDTESEVWQQFCERIAAYMYKATKEAKVHTTWVQPNVAYDEAVREFVFRILRDPTFLDDMRQFATHVAYYGQFNSLSQTMLKLTAPGVPDIYQGNELWDLSLVDPDNRRPVDYQQRRTLLTDLKQQIAEAGDDLTPLTRDLLASSNDGRIKLYLHYCVLMFRREHPDLFAHGTYFPLESTGTHAEQVCAFKRVLENEQEILVVVPRLVAHLSSGDERHPPMGEVWGSTRLALPGEVEGRRYRNLFTGEVLSVGRDRSTPVLKLAEVLAAFPVALLERLA